MKIGIFGDSFATKTDFDIWWRYLEEYGHTVTCFGEGGSSILFSAKLILENSRNFDLCIWAVTNPPRFSFKDVNNKDIHYLPDCGYMSSETTPDIVEKMKAADLYFKNIFDWEEGDLIGTSLYHYLSTKVNLMALPCFYSPLRTDFYLYEACEREARHFFPKKDLADIYKEYDDVRTGHFCPNNHRILARLINENLKPGIFQTDYDNFEKPEIDINEAFIPISQSIKNWTFLSK